MAHQSIITPKHYYKCSNCNKDLTKGDQAFCEKHQTSECSECEFHKANGTRTIAKYNAWLKK